MDLDKIDKELVRLEVKKGMQYHVANRFIDIPWSFTGKSLYAGKIFFAIISMIDFSQDYQDRDLKFNIDEIADAVGISRHGQVRYELVREALATLRRQEIHIDVDGTVIDDNGIEVPFKVNGECSWIAEYITNDYTREAVVRLPRLLRPIILNLKTIAFKGNVQKAFETLAPFRSPYFIHLYLLIIEKAEYASKVGGYWKPSLEDLYSLLCLKKSYCTWQNFKSRILDPFVVDVAHNDAINFFVEYDPVYTPKGYGKGRRAVEAVKIWTVPKPKKVETSKKEHDVHETSVEEATDKYIPAAEEAVVDIELVSTSTKIKQQLLKYAVLDSVADKLIKDYPDDFLLEQIADFESHDVFTVKTNAGAFLSKKIENAWKQITTVNKSKNEAFDKLISKIDKGSGSLFAAAQAAVAKERQAKEAREAELQAEAEKALQAEQQAREAERKAAEDREKAIRDIIDTMTDEQKAEIVEKAKEKANEFQRKMLEGKTFDELMSGAHSVLIKNVIEEYGVQQSMF